LGLWYLLGLFDCGDGRTLLNGVVAAELGTMTHTCEEDLILTSTNEKVGNNSDWVENDVGDCCASASMFPMLPTLRFALSIGVTRGAHLRCITSSPLVVPRCSTTKMKWDCWTVLCGANLANQAARHQLTFARVLLATWPSPTSIRYHTLTHPSSSRTRHKLARWTTSSVL
jgi:hypothetical protein